MTATRQTIAFAEFAEKGADADLLRGMVQYVAQRVMDPEAAQGQLYFPGFSQAVANGRESAGSDERVGAFLSRPIEGDWPYVRIDATYLTRSARPAGSCRSPK